MTNYNEQARAFLADTRTTMTIKFQRNEVNVLWDDNTVRPHYRVYLSNEKGRMNFPFWDSVHNMKNNVKPTEYDILSCLEKHDVGEYRDFCNDFGYEFNADSKHIYNACKKQYSSLCRIFTEEQMEELREIQ